MGKRINRLIDRIRKNVQLPEMKILPGQLAFFIILTLIPIIALFMVLASNLNISTEFIESLIDTSFPTIIVDVIKYISENDAAHSNFVVFFVLSLVLASNGTNSIIIASNQIYKIKSKGFIYDRIKAIFMLMILIILLIFIILVPIFGNFIIDNIVHFINNDTVGSYIYNIYQIISLPLSWFIMFFAIKLLYTLAPDASIPSRNVNYGTLFTSLSWVIFTNLYSVYIDVFGGYSSLYGSISSLIVLMWWIYFLSYIFVMGMALNVSKYEVKDKKEE